MNTKPQASDLDDVEKTLKAQILKMYPDMDDVFVDVIAKNTIAEAIENLTDA